MRALGSGLGWCRCRFGHALFVSVSGGLGGVGIHGVGHRPAEARPEGGQANEFCQGVWRVIQPGVRRSGREARDFPGGSSQAGRAVPDLPGASAEVPIALPNLPARSPQVPRAPRNVRDASADLGIAPPDIPDHSPQVGRPPGKVRDASSKVGIASPNLPDASAELGRAILDPFDHRSILL